jgi:hypothetical protein
MSDDAVTIIQIIKGDYNSGARRAGLNGEQRAGRACLVCGGTQDINTEVGWVDDNPVRVHSFRLGHYQLGETLPSNETASCIDHRGSRSRHVPVNAHK